MSAARARHGASPGFTLLELLIAISILALLMMVVYISFNSVTDTTLLARDEGERMRMEQYLWRNLSTNFAAIYADQAQIEPDYRLEGINEEGPYGPADSIRFCTALPMSDARALPGILRVVSYTALPESELGEETAVAGEAVDESRAGERMMLLVREEPLVLAATDFTGEVQQDEDASAQGMRELAIPIRSFDVWYYDGQLEEWVEEWDSTASTALPWAVRVSVNMDRPEEEVEKAFMEGIDPLEEPDLRFMAPVQVGMGTLEPFFDWNHMRTSDLEGGDLFDGARQEGR
jgi:prepilin-type N-terminal cleavage/methylation domain-containing protein